MTATTIPALVDAAAENHADVEALVDGDTRLTFAELRDEVKRVARSFVAMGVRPGDRVAMWAPNMGEWVTAALGASTAGAVLVPINTRFKGAEAAYVLRRSGARILVTVRGFLGTDYPAMLDGEDLPDLERTIVLRQDQFADDPEAKLPAIEPTDLSDVIFTSGTTGKPKGVMTTHAQTTRVFEDWSGILGLAEGDRYLIVNPFFHTFGYKAGIVACLIRGATIVPHAVFDVPSVLQRVDEERITMLPGPPTLFQTILNAPERKEHDLSSLRLCATGAAVIPVEMIRRMREELTFESIITAYGLTESTGVVTMCRPEDDAETIATTSGRAIHDVEVRVLDDGEIVCRGYNVMLGYWDDDEATAAAIDADGWLHTGDIGVMDDRGYVQITDRKKDMFICGGFNAYPAEIEQVLLTHPSIAQVAVVGTPDERMGEVGAAFVVARADADPPDPDEIVAWSRERMANYKVPRRVVVVDALPLNASGKVLKFELRDRLKN